jgi:poly-gamma-glutamate capsule biosynthesis protein CapA/YwtB (metallophosphatase superfamily)
MSRSAVLAVLIAWTAAACTTESRAEPEPEPPSSPSASAAPSTPEPSADPEPGAELVVVAHATVPQLHLTRADAERITSGELDRWRRFRVVHDRAPTPGSIAVIPLEEVGPTVVVARVGRFDPVRDDPDAVHVTLVGDVMLVRGVPDPKAALAPMRARLRAADLTIGNLESTLSTRGEPTQGGDSFGASRTLLGPLADAGFDALSLANNHVGDYGETALLDTLRVFGRSPIKDFGAGADIGEAAQPALLAAGGTTFAFLAFNAIGETPMAGAGQPGSLSIRMPPRTGPLVPADLARVTRAIRRMEQRADVVVVLPHWGAQYTHTPEPIQRTVSRALVRAGADLVVGGHPHWVQGVDVVDGVPVIHSLGNFVFDMDFAQETMEGVVLEATFWGADLKAVRFVPYRMDPGTFAPREVPGRDVLADLWGSSTGPFAS